MRIFFKICLVSTFILGSIIQSVATPLACDDKILNLPKINGFMTLIIDVENNKLYAELPADGGYEFLYVSTLTSGFGSRDIGGDRGTFDTRDIYGFQGGRLVAFQRIGRQMILVERNTAYYSPSASLGAYDDAGLSFPNSLLGNFRISCERDQKVIADITSLFLLDGGHIPEILKDQGKYKIDTELSLIDLAHAHSSSVGNSIEVDSIFSFSTDDAADDKVISRLAANARRVLVRERTSLIQLPQTKFQGRTFDIRSGFFDQTYFDPRRLPKQSMRQSFIVRHALTKKNPEEPLSEPDAPIVFYVDPSMPSELQTLAMEGVTWWNSAFEAAGFKNAIQAKVASPDFDLFDAGVNAILWVPRETRGYSFSGVITDPRTGQVLKAMVRIDAMRLGADRLLLDALSDPYVERPDLASRDEALRQRFRLLVAHEVGHTLGLRHQFIASSQGMSSVMEYLFPNFALDTSGAVSFHDLFPVELGTWDKSAIFYGYHPLQPGEEADALRSLIEGTEAKGAYWITDQDTADAHPWAQRWDRGTDPVAEMTKVLDIRRAALARFSKYAIPQDEPLASLQDALAPIYLLHQFELKAVAAMLGGYTYRYSLRDGEGPRPVSPSQQREALQTLLRTIDVETLWPGHRILDLMSPRPPAYAASSESFGGETGPIFDAFRPIEDATTLTMEEVLKPSRAARLAQAKAHDISAPDLDEVLGEIVNHTWNAPAQEGNLGAVQRTIALTVLRAIIATATNKGAPAEVRGACWAEVENIEKLINSGQLSSWKDANAYAKYAIAAAKGKADSFEFSERKPPVLDPMGDPQ
jgi:Met-zincin/Domain of unknown function (DUF5117)